MPAKPKDREVVTIDPKENLPPQVDQQGATILGMIDRVLADPNFPVDKLERLFDLHQRHIADMAKKAYLTALAEMQPELPVIEKRGTIKTNIKDKQGNKTGEQKDQSKYALWEDIVESIRPILHKHGFSLQFKTDQPTPDRVSVTGILGHRGGHTESTALALPIDTSGSKNNVQGWGSSVQYAKRYVANALLNLVSRDMEAEDDDGQAGGGDPALSAEQIEKLKALLKDTSTSEETFLATIAKSESIEDIRASGFGLLVNMLEAKKKIQAKMKAEAGV